MRSDTDPAARPLGFTRTGRRRVAVGVALIVAAVVLGVCIALVAGNAPLPFDQWWMAWMLSIRSPALLAFGGVMNWVGGGWFAIIALPLLVIVLLLLLRRPWGAMCFGLAELLSAAVTQLLKQSLERPRPSEILIATDIGSFPSGHVANAATLAVALCVLVPRAWSLLAATLWVALMAFSRTLLGAHWASDTVGGALIGCGVALIVCGVFAGQLRREYRARRPRPARG